MTFTYRVTDGTGTSQVATVTVDVTARPGEPDLEPQPKPLDPVTPEPPRVGREGLKPLDQRKVEAATTTTTTATPTAAQVFTLPSTKACVSRRHFRIRIKQGDYRRLTVDVNGKRVKTLKGKRITAAVDLRGLPKGRFKVKIAATLTTGKVVKTTRQYRTCTKKGARS